MDWNIFLQIQDLILHQYQGHSAPVAGMYGLKENGAGMATTMHGRMVIGPYLHPTAQGGIQANGNRKARNGIGNQVTGENKWEILFTSLDVHTMDY